MPRIIVTADGPSDSVMLSERISGVLLGAVGRLAQRLDARRAQSTEAEGNGRALVLVKTAVDRAIERRWPELESSGYRASVARSGYEAGSRAGTHVDLGDHRLGHGSLALPDAAAG